MSGIAVHPISARALAEIEADEIGSRAAFNPRPTWPGGSSGVTVGVGYDLGYESDTQIVRDWIGCLPAETVRRLSNAAGMTGNAARALAFEMQDIAVPFEAAERVFRELNIPRYSAMTAAAFPNCADLSPDSFGALVSLVFNRGPGMADAPGDTQHRRREMREIHDAMAERRFPDVPPLILAMQRLWQGVPGMGGLVSRRAREAALFAAGLPPPPPAP